MHMTILAPGDALFETAQLLIADIFKRKYGANLQSFPLRILAVVHDGSLRCAAGLRDEGQGFFSECYLDLPVEKAIGHIAGRTVRRGEILELTSLAAERPGALAVLLRGFAEFGLGAGYKWGLFTATRRLRQMARRVGIDLIELAAAGPEHIANPEIWGSYYDNDPVVCAVDGISAQPRLESGLLTMCAPDERTGAQ